jgi:hypothetical protein
MAMTNAGGLVKAIGPKPVAAKTCGPGLHGPPEKAPDKVHKPNQKKRGKLKFRLKDYRGNAIPDEWFRVTLPDGAEAHGLLDHTGSGVVSGLDLGTKCRLTFPNLKYARWFSVGQPETAAVTYVAAEEDTLSAIAARYNVPGWKALWDYSGNATLRRDSCLPEPVLAGKQICIPRPDRELTVRKQEHDLRLEQYHPARTARFRFVDATTGRPLPDLTIAILQPDLQTRDEVTNKDGEVVINGQRGEIFAVTRIVRPKFLGLGDPIVFRTPVQRSIDDLLKDTLIGSSDPKTRVRYVDRQSDAPSFRPVSDRPGAGAGTIRDLPLWEVVIPASALNRVSGLTCAVPSGHPGRPPVVCESVEWDPFAIRFGTSQLTLPLDPAFLVRVQALEGGHVPRWPPDVFAPPPYISGGIGGLAWPPPGDPTLYLAKAQWPGNPLWPLESSIDIGYQNVFVYQIDADPSGAPVISPVAKDVCCKDRFLPPAAPGTIAATVGSDTVDVPVVRLRIATVATLVCNKTRNDFEPGGLMDAARLYPIEMFVASLPLDSVSGGVRIVRPGSQPPHHPNLRSYLRSGLFTDNNIRRLPFPTWGELFAYYNVTNPAGTYTVVHRLIGQDEPLEWGSSHAQRRPQIADRITPTIAENLEKLPGQGSYDNIHIAPPMFVDPPPNPPLTGSDNMRIAATFADITMAPFCVHDCLHTHWRWAPHTAKTQQYGWSLKGKPYSAPGAPMVAANQKITMTVAGTGFHYKADIEKPDPGQWQIVYHHGSAYSVGEADVVPSARTIRTGLFLWLAQPDLPNEVSMLPSHTWGRGGGLWLPPGSSDWPLFYWHLRYTVRLPLYSAFRHMVDPGSFTEDNVVAVDSALLAKAIVG